MNFIIFISSILFLLISILSLTIIFSKSSNKHHNLPTSPLKLPIIGNLHQLYTRRHLPHRSLHKLSRKHGPIISLKLGKITAVVASSAAVAKELFKEHDLDCCNRPSLTAPKALSFGNSDVGFARYDEQWRESRKICTVHFFNTKKVASFRYIREEEVYGMMNSISRRRSEAANLSEELLQLAMNVTCRSAFGKRFCRNNGVRIGDVDGIIRERQALLAGFFFEDYLPVLGFLDALTGKRARLQKNLRAIDEFCRKVLVLDQSEDHDSDEDLIDALLDMQMTLADMSRDHIKGVLLNLLVAGSDTSAAAVEWAMTELIRNPQLMKKAQDEVRGVNGNKGKVEETDLDLLPYLKSIVKEIMRLHPPAPLLLQRETIQHCKINGYDVPAKSRLLVSPFAIGRDPNVWERPDEFYPERFENSCIDFWGQDFELIPFGAGRRICPGMHSGIAVVELALANLLYWFDWEFAQGNDERGDRYERISWHYSA